MWLIVSLILIFAGPWFEHQQTVGLYMLIIAAIEIFFYILMYAIGEQNARIEYERHRAPPHY